VVDDAGFEGRREAGEAAPPTVPGRVRSVLEQIGQFSAKRL
jgi:hypothetical protein